MLGATALAAAGDSKYPGNFSWNLISDKEIKRVTGFKDSFSKSEHAAEPLFEEPSMPMNALELVSTPASRRRQLPAVWEVPPFAVIGPPRLDSGIDSSSQSAVKNGDTQGGKSAYSRSYAALHRSGSGLRSILNSLNSESKEDISPFMTPNGRFSTSAGLSTKTKDAKKVPEGRNQRRSNPEAFGDITPAQDSQDNIPAPDLRPRSSVYSDFLNKPDSSLPRPFSLKRCYTRNKGFFQVAAYGGDLFTEKYYRTLKAASPNRRDIQGFGSEAFISFIAAPEKKKPFNLDDAKGEYTFSDIEPEGTADFEELDPGLIKSSKAPAFKKVPALQQLPEGFEDELRRQLARIGYENIEVQRPPKSISSYSQHAACGTPPAAGVSEPDDAEDSAGGSSDDIFSIGESSDSEPLHGDDGKPANPFAEETELKAATDGVYVMEIYYPEQSIVCELACDSRIGGLQELFNAALLVQSRILKR